MREPNSSCSISGLVSDSMSLVGFPGRFSPLWRISNLDCLRLGGGLKLIEIALGQDWIAVLRSSVRDDRSGYTDKRVTGFLIVTYESFDSLLILFTRKSFCIISDNELI
ncbi:hypothetical protein AYI70_g4326 [Smittium culicis]|uniref:Uncharacterized protein n=1 Tax=Smittium culicis TaxID=133412 RepID=A0A1R1XZJ7_9FUNG|nr:hypothetical protein AYI70_g4326 [Smittium culicis]